MQPSDAELDKTLKNLAGEADWTKIFEGVASVRIEVEGAGPSIALRFSKKEGIPVTVVEEGKPGAAVVGVRRVNELDYYSLSFNKLKGKLSLNQYQLRALIWYAKIKENPEYYKEFQIGKQLVKRYSEKALRRLKELLSNTAIEKVVDEFKKMNPRHR